MLDGEIRATLRLAVHAFRAGQRKRIFEPVLHVGELDGEHLTQSVAPEISGRGTGLCTDLALAMADRATEITPRPAAWLTRVGTPDPHDLDTVWIPALHQAFGILDLEPRCIVVITKAGWYDPVQEDSARWQRLRLRARELDRIAREAPAET